MSRTCASLSSYAFVPIVIGGRIRGAGVSEDERPSSSKPVTREDARYGIEAFSVPKEQGTKLLDELKGLVHSFPQERRKLIIAALKEIFSELDAGAERPAPRGA